MRLHVCAYLRQVESNASVFPHVVCQELVISLEELQPMQQMQ
jgi:hypothetical protein